MIDDELDDYSDTYEYTFDENYCQQETLNLVVFRICGILIIYYKICVMADASVVVESDIKYALVYSNMGFRKNKYSTPQNDDLFNQALRSLMFFFLRLI